jgi:hypothetical protein
MYSQFSSLPFGVSDNTGILSCFLSTDVFLQSADRYADGRVYNGSVFVDPIPVQINKTQKIPKYTRGRILFSRIEDINGIESIIMIVGFDGSIPLRMEFVGYLNNGTNPYGTINCFFLSSIYSSLQTPVVYNNIEYKVIYTETPVLLVDHKTLSRISNQLKKLSGKNYYLN